MRWLLPNNNSFIRTKPYQFDYYTLHKRAAFFRLLYGYWIRCAMGSNIESVNCSLINLFCEYACACVCTGINVYSLLLFFDKPNVRIDPHCEYIFVTSNNAIEINLLASEYCNKNIATMYALVLVCLCLCCCVSKSR